LKTIILILSIVLSPVLAVCQNDTINQTDINGLKQGHWIYYGKDRPDKGYPDTAIIEAGPYVNERKVCGKNTILMELFEFKGFIKTTGFIQIVVTPHGQIPPTQIALKGVMILLWFT
jgi:hypothetical protein